jgi:EPTP domain-containing protein
MRAALTEMQRIPTSGARAVEAFTAAGLELLAIPQLARDMPGGPPGMNGGDSDTELLLLRLSGERFEPWSTLPAPGGEDAEFFTIGERSFLAIASIRTGSGPYEFATESRIFAWDRDQFVPFQSVATFAAKQWKHWSIGERHFLGLAQGVVRAGHEDRNRDSVVYEWDGSSFVEHQRIPSRWAYNWHAFSVGDTFFVAHADHVGASVLYRWDGAQLQPHQTLAAKGGRAFATFDDGTATYLVAACISAATRVMRWDGERFKDFQTLNGLGARELAVVRHDGRLLVVRINFILGTPTDPHPVLDSQIYEWDGGALRVVARFPTCGGTDVAVLGDDAAAGIELVVSNSLTPQLRFAAETVRYSLSFESR